MTLLAVLLAATAAGLLMPGLAPRAGPSRFGRLLGVGFAAAVSVLVATTDGLRLALALIVLACAAAVSVMVRRGRRARAAEANQVLVVEVCEALAGELRAGQPPVSGLEHCLDVWPSLEPVVAAGRLGADIPAALRRLAGLPGAQGLCEIASAWQVSERSGTGLAAALAQVAVTARERQATRHLVRGELASAHATARLVAVLPLAVLAMSAGIGGDPWTFLFASPLGLCCLALGASFAFAGLLWIERIAAAVLTG